LVERIGRFEIVGELGRGAMGTVYQARDTVLDRQVALKTVAPGLLGSKDTVERFQREARAAAKLQHPNIVTIYDLGEAEGVLYIAMELLDGHDLSVILAPPDRLSVEQKVRIVAQTCRGLDHAHKQGVFHRDVKPANIHVRADGTVKIVDFGIARLADSNMTQTGLVLGTPSYIAPEALMGRRPDHRGDMWAVGIILFEMLAGRRPYEAPTIASLVYKIVHDPLPPMGRGAHSLPPTLIDVVTRALEKDPGRRYRDLAEMAVALECALGITPAGALSLPPAARERAYELNFAEARELLADDDYEGALAAARRAMALEPSRTSILVLVGVIEERLRAADTAQTSAPIVPATRRTAAPATAAAAGATAAVEVPLSPLTQELKVRGAAVFRDLGCFGEPPATQSVALSPVRDLLAVSGADGAIRLWDLQTRTCAATLRTELHQRTGHDALGLALCFSPDGSLLASGHVDGHVHLWDVAMATEVPVKLRHDAGVGALAFSPDGATLASGSMDSNLRLWDVGTALAGDARRELHRQPAGVTALAWVAGGDWILTGHVNRVLRLLDARTGKLLASLRGPEAAINLIELAPDGVSVAVASQDRTVRLIDLQRREPVVEIDGLRRAVTALCHFPDGEHFATVGQDNAVQIWDLRSRRPLVTLWGPADESFVGIVLFGSGEHLAAALADGRIRIWGPAA
jgi:hypothetical protein